LIAYLSTGFLRMRLFTLDQSTALLFICIDALMIGAWLWLVLAFFGRRQRFVQTITAALGVGLLILMLDVTIRSAQLALGWSDELSRNWLRARFLVVSVVFGRVFMLALDRGLITGIALTIAIIYSTQAVVQLMLDLRG
ncbi:MAG TPA: hypothetical protein VNR40_10790, partial [Steroidobacter sp.]|nr:hypothetical protein [Steroidobacter sp.]